MRAGNGADVVDLKQRPGSISPRGGHERRPAGRARSLALRGYGDRARREDGFRCGKPADLQATSLRSLVAIGEFVVNNADHPD